MKHLVIFASGNGSNAENLIRFFQDHEQARVVQVLTNNPRAKVIDRCNNLKISCLCFNRTAFSKTNDILDYLKNTNPDLIILAGFLWKIPESIIQAFPNKIVNLHPALLPKFGGKGMYGKHVHVAVKEAGEIETGITIHYVNEHYDEGAIIFQVKCDVSASDSVEEIASKIHDLEMEHFPKVIENLISVG